MTPREIREQANGPWSDPWHGTPGQLWWDRAGNKTREIIEVFSEGFRARDAYVVTEWRKDNPVDLAVVQTWTLIAGSDWEPLV